MKRLISEIRSSWHHGKGEKYSRKGQQEKALQHFLEALNQAQKTDNEGSIAVELESIGVTYLRLGKYAFAKRYLFQALKVFSELSNREDNSYFSSRVEEIRKLLEHCDHHLSVSD